MKGRRGSILHWLLSEPFLVFDNLLRKIGANKKTTLLWRHDTVQAHEKKMDPMGK
jgi:hypothetical protein